MEDRIVAKDADNRQDDALVRAFQGGEQKAFDALVKRHQGRIINLCFRMLGDLDKANDFAQETFIKAFNGLYRFRLDASFSTWLYRIAVNTCKNRLTSLAYRFRKKTFPIVEESPMEINSEPLHLEDSNPLPLKCIEDKERAAQIQKAISSLSPDQRSAVILRDIEGLSYEEIAAIVRQNQGTVKSRLSRARQALKERLRPIFI